MIPECLQPLSESLQQVHVQLPWFYAVCFGALGAVIGSFINVCAERLPRGESVVSPGSHCACGAPIPCYLNVPVFGWLLLRGRAACCGRRIGCRHLLVELFSAALFAACWLLLPLGLALAGMLLGSLLLVLSLIDFDTMLLPDSLNIALAVAGVGCSILLPALHDAPSGFAGVISSIGASLTGLCVGAGLAYWLRLGASLLFGREALGEGDVILLGGIGAFCGWRGAVFALFGGAVAGALVLLPLMLAQRLCRQREDAEHAARAASLASCEGDEAAEFALNSGSVEVPFGPWLAIGAMAWFLYFRAPFNTWLNEFLAAVTVAAGNAAGNAVLQ